MAKSLFNIGANWTPKKQSISEISKELWAIATNLSEVEELFITPVLSKEGYDNVSVKIKEMAKIEAIAIISNTILQFSKSDISEHENEGNPTTNFSRDFGFSFVLSYQNNSKAVISFVPRMGSIQANGIGTISISKEIDKDFDWYYSILKAITESTNSQVGSVSFRETPFNEICNSYKFPLGWITYFSNDYELQIPDDLEGVEYEHTDKGKYLILTREDFTIDKESYEEHKQKLLNIMEEIKQRVPEYSK